jgi:predicted KAP-like P-loop ATPase
MYPDGDLNQLAVHKLALRQRIFVRRRQSIVAANRIAQPFEKVDRIIAQWRRISPVAKLAAVPMAFLFKRALFPRAKILGTLLRWGPVAFKVVRGLSTAR